MRMEGKPQPATVLVTVKATPQPSKSYGDTVCVAGLRIDGAQPEWIRLYPVPFRWLGSDSQFKKYSLLNVRVARRHRDSRPESYSPDVMSLTASDPLKTWAKRHEYVGLVEPTSTCDLIHAATNDHSAPSLGLVYPNDVSGVSFEQHEPWTEEQIRTMQAMAKSDESALFGPAAPAPKVLTAPRLKMRYRYRCSSRACGGHTGRNLDWELTAFQNKFRNLSGSELEAKIEERFLDALFADDRESGFFMGNFENPARRSRFSVLGVYWPEKEDTIAPPRTLF